MRGTGRACWARIARGHANTPPTSVTNSRRCMSLPALLRRHLNDLTERFKGLLPLQIQIRMSGPIR